MVDQIGANLRTGNTYRGNDGRGPGIGKVTEVSYSPNDR